MSKKSNICLVRMPRRYFTGVCITVNITGLYETKILFGPASFLRDGRGLAKGGEDYERTINRGIRSNPVVERAG
jgi:hypothetical protein